MSEERWKVDDGSQWSGDPEDPPMQAYAASVHDDDGWCLEIAGAPEGCSPLDEMEMLRTVAAAMNAAERDERDRKRLLARFAALRAEGNDG